MSDEYRTKLEKQCDLLGIKYTDKTRISALKMSIYLQDKPEEPEEFVEELKEIKKPSKTCKFEGCNIMAAFGLQETRHREFCGIHRSEQHVNLANKKCIYDGCDKQASFGLLGARQASYCSNHHPADHVNIKRKRCANINCNIIANFGLHSDKIPIFCGKHIPSKDYINLKSKRCNYTSCMKIPYFGKAGSKIVEFCRNHRPENYVDVKSSMCKNTGCTKRAVFGLAGSKLLEFCKTHRPTEEYVNILNKPCKYEQCVRQPVFGFPGYSKEYCSMHKLSGMVKTPTKVKKETIKTCNYCETDIHYGEEFCSGCKNYIKTGTTVKRHAKELAVKALLDSHEIKYIHDRVIVGGCSKKRPDFVIPTEWGTIILEVDEHQHNRKTYTCECEITRMKQIYHDEGVENLLFIRYNPDDYKPITGVQMTVKSREDYLIKYLKKQMAELTFKGLGAVYLFYDGFERTIAPEIDLFDPYH